MLLSTGVGGVLDTFKGQVSDGVPVGPLRTRTVKLPAARTAGPLSSVDVRLRAVTTQEESVGQPGPRKKTSAFERKLFPSTVKLNACPLIGGLGDVFRPFIAGAGEATVETTSVAEAVFDNPEVLVTFKVIVCEAAANGNAKLGRLLMIAPLLRHS